jgi:thiosulfate/3-mercaptopyruvate sulfurtransferase
MNDHPSKLDNVMIRSWWLAALWIVWHAPLGFAAHPNVMVTPAWVKAVQQSHRQTSAPRPKTYKNKRFVILATNWGPLSEAKEYRAGHVPGAVYLNTDEFENGYPRWHLQPLPVLQRVIGKLGITRDTTVIVYSSQTIAAARVWWILNYAGVSDVRILDGGYAAWQAAGFDGETAIQKPRAVTFVAQPRAHWRATTSYVKARLATGDVWLADARSPAEFRGEVSGYDYLQQRGRLPGAIAIGDADDKALLYQTADGRLLPRAEIASRWTQVGLTSSRDQFHREVIFYCGSGWRSSLTFLYAYLLGYKNIRNYSDGWSGWSTTYTQDAHQQGITPGWRQMASGNPIATGQE